MCGASMKESDVARLLNGNLIIVAEYAKQGRSGGEMAVGLGLNMALNGIDFTDPSPKYEFKASNGTYGYKNGEAGWAISVYWARDILEGAAQFKGGDKVGFNLLAVDSFVRNVRLRASITDPFSSKVVFDPGPLSFLIDGDVQFDTRNPLSIGVKLRLRADLLAFELSSVGKYSGSGVNHADTFTWHIDTLRTPLPDIIKAAQSGVGYGLTFEDSKYRSPTYGVDQDFGTSKIMVLADEQKRVHIEGNYDASLRITRPGETIPATWWQRGFVSSRTENKTEYFCDEAKTKRLGVATHAVTLKSGSFVVDATGARVNYGIVPF
jgi:hypothetical protein